MSMYWEFVLGVAVPLGVMAGALFVVVSRIIR